MWLGVTPCTREQAAPKRLALAHPHRLATPATVSPRIRLRPAALGGLARGAPAAGAPRGGPQVPAEGQLQRPRPHPRCPRHLAHRQRLVGVGLDEGHRPAHHRRGHPPRPTPRSGGHRGVGEGHQGGGRHQLSQRRGQQRTGPRSTARGQLGLREGGHLQPSAPQALVQGGVPVEAQVTCATGAAPAYGHRGGALSGHPFQHRQRQADGAQRRGLEARHQVVGGGEPEHPTRSQRHLVAATRVLAGASNPAGGPWWRASPSRCSAGRPPPGWPSPSAGGRRGRRRPR